MKNIKCTYNPYLLMFFPQINLLQKGRQKINPGKLQYSVTYHYLIVIAITWLEYCRYGVKHKQSINQAIG